jgi:N6-adenosine-specific RNA methylase IME4
VKYERIGQHEVHPVASIFPMIEGDELRALADDIRANGLREPVTKLWVPDPIAPKTQKPLILDGRNRLRACELAKVAPEFVKYEGPSEGAALLSFVLSKNMARRHLNESQRALVAARCIELVPPPPAPAATKKSSAKRVANLPPAERKARDVAGVALNVSGRSVQHAVTALKKAAPEVVRALERGEVAVSAAAELAELPKTVQKTILEKSKGKSGTIRAHIRQHERIELGKKLDAEPMPSPKGPFHVIVADPAWKYDTRDEDASHRGVTPYPTMSTEQICMLPVAELAHDDAILFLWYTNQHPKDALDVAIAWGFTQKGIGTWVKPKIGLGRILRNRTEHFYICTRGNPTLIPPGNLSTVIEGPVREHSRKPDSFYELVEAIAPGSKVELFAREPRKGWARWGAESEKFAVGARA